MEGSTWPPGLSASATVKPGAVDVGRVGEEATLALERWALIVSITRPDWLDRNEAEPTNWARIALRPTWSPDVCRVTSSPSIGRVPRTVLPSTKSTVPMGTPPASPTALTETVSATDCPTLADLGCAVNSVFVR